MDRSEALTAPRDVGAPGKKKEEMVDKNGIGTAGLELPHTDLAKFVRNFRNQSQAASDTVHDRAQAQNTLSAPFGDVLSRRGFVRQLQNEQRRADRSKGPLSIALFRVDEKRSGLDDVHDLVTLLRDAKRETDILGYLGKDLVGVLLLNTTEEGAQVFMRKIAQRTQDTQLVPLTGTYPGQNLCALIAESQKPADSHRPRLEGNARYGYRLKRSLDIIGAITGLLLFSPVILVTACAIAATSPGPIILRQQRLGRQGVPFVFYKFRSMLVNVDDRIHRDYVTRLINGDLEGINKGSAERPLYKLKFDPRVTSVGRIIRKTSIDELPQLVNVLKGEMSLVGPRPPLAYEAENYQSWHLRRILEAKPGMTGLWQVEGRSRTSFDEMVRLDLRYIRNCSLSSDLKILIKTIKVVFRCEGAN